MTIERVKKIHIAIVGGGPSGLFVYKSLVDSGHTDIIVEIFEKENTLGAGMPYSSKGSNREHVTNVSGNEIPTIGTSVGEWMATLQPELLKEFNFDLKNFSDFKVLPRLLFGQYLNTQFELVRREAARIGLTTNVHFNTEVTDILDHPEIKTVSLELNNKTYLDVNYVVICTGHVWPKIHEGDVPDYFDSPYPPAKLGTPRNHTVAIKGASLTAIDAVRTLARQNGTFVRKGNHEVSFHLYEGSKDFKIILHSRQGLLPGIRFHLSDSHLSKDSLLSKEDLERHMEKNNGFLSLDFVFEEDFKKSFYDKDPAFYHFVKDMSLEEFVEAMMRMREKVDPFLLFKREYQEAEKSIRREQSIYWREMLAILSFAMNYPAKHFSAEDMQRLQYVLMPLISLVIAFVPQSSCEEVMALHTAGCIEIITVDEDSFVEPNSGGGAIYQYCDEQGQKHSTAYQTYIDCTGQPHLSFESFPFKTLKAQAVVAQARLKFKSSEKAISKLALGEKNIEYEGGHYYLKVPGITINDSFQVVNEGGGNKRIYSMAVPYMSGYNPDYSGLDFCEEASKIIVTSILK